MLKLELFCERKEKISRDIEMEVRGWIQKRKGGSRKK